MPGQGRILRQGTDGRGLGFGYARKDGDDLLEVGQGSRLVYGNANGMVVRIPEIDAFGLGLLFYQGGIGLYGQGIEK